MSQTFFNSPDHNDRHEEKPVEAGHTAILEKLAEEEKPPEAEPSAVPTTAAEPKRAAFYATPRDDTTVRRFRTTAAAEAPLTVIAGLNKEFHLDMTPADYKWLVEAYRKVVMRDPTVGELRLLTALAHTGAGSPDRLAVDRLYTDSDAIAETWADMMDKHCALWAHRRVCRRPDEEPNAVYAPPCTLTEALGLSGAYDRALSINREELNRHEPLKDTVMLTHVSQLPEAVAAGYGIKARLRLDGGRERILCTRAGRPLPVTAERAGDMLLLLRSVSIRDMEGLVAGERVKKHPDIADIRAVSGTSLLAAILSLCSAADIFVARALPAGKAIALRGRLPIELLCRIHDGAHPRFLGAEPAADYLVRVSVNRVQTLSAILKSKGITAVVLGQVRANDRTVIHIQDASGTRDIPAVELPSDMLRTAATVRRDAYHLLDNGSTEGGETVGVAVTPCATARVSAVSAENGLPPDGTADGGEVITLTATDRALLTLPEAGIQTHTVTADITDEGQAFGAAAHILHAAVAPLLDVGMAPSTLFLAISMAVRAPVYANGVPCPGGMVLSAICGINRAAFDMGIPAEHPHLEILPVEGGKKPSVELTVTAWGEVNKIASEPDPTQWKFARQKPAPSSPRVLLPVLRPAYEGCVRAVAAALNQTCPTQCTVCPVAVCPASDTGERELNPQSVDQLTELLAEADLLVLAMPAEDARLLLDHPALSDAVRRHVMEGHDILAIHGACRPLAEMGLLPAVLSEEPAVLPAADTLAPVTYRFPVSDEDAALNPPVTEARRLLRRDVCRVVSADENALITLHTKAGDVADGFVGGEGRVLGLLNGLDALTAAHVLRRLTEHTSH